MHGVLPRRYLRFHQQPSSVHVDQSSAVYQQRSSGTTQTSSSFVCFRSAVFLFIVWFLTCIFCLGLLMYILMYSPKSSLRSGNDGNVIIGQESRLRSQTDCKRAKRPSQILLTTVFGAKTKCELSSKMFPTHRLGHKLSAPPVTSL